MQTLSPFISMLSNSQVYKVFIVLVYPHCRDELETADL